MVDDRLAFRCSVSEEIHGSLVEKRLVGVSIDNVGLRRTDFAQRAVEQYGIDLHPPCVKHRTEQRVVFLDFFLQQNGHAEHFERRHGNQPSVATETNALRRRNADAQSRVRTRPATHRHRVERQQLRVDIRQGFVDENARFHGVVRTLAILAFKDAQTVLTDRHGTDFRARFYVQNCRHQ